MEKRREMKEIIIRVCIGLLVMPAVAFVTFVLMIFTSLTASESFFYTHFTMWAGIAVEAIILLALCKLLNWKRFAVCSIACVIGYGSVYAWNETRLAYKHSLAVVDDQGVDLEEYTPFGNQTLAVSLDEAATLSIQDDLPLLDGATALYPLYSAFARAVYPAKDYNPYDSEVMSNNTVNAYKRVVDGEADMIFAAAPSKAQQAYAESRGKQLELTPIGREAFVFFVQADNPVGNVTVEQIQGIYSGEITNWTELGGKDKSIRAF